MDISTDHTNTILNTSKDARLSKMKRQNSRAELKKRKEASAAVAEGIIWMNDHNVDHPQAIPSSLAALVFIKSKVGGVGGGVAC